LSNPPRAARGGLGKPRAGGSWRNVNGMCRSIKTLREPYTEDVTEADMQAAALQYVRKISGFRAPAAHNADAFDRAVQAVTAATAELLAHLEVRGTDPARAH
jgi:hypothetical protein